MFSFRVFVLSFEVRGFYVSFSVVVKRSKVKVKGKEVKKEVRLGGVFCSVDSGAYVWCVRFL